MSFLFTLLILVIFVGVFASVFREGLWSNALLFINQVTAALLALDMFEPLASWLEEMIPSGAYYWDIVSLYAIFALSLFIFRGITEAISKVRVRFFKPVDLVGGLAMAVVNSYAFVCFIMLTLHTAPLERNFMFEGFQPKERMVFGLAPDRQYLGFMQKVTLGSLGRMAPEDNPETAEVESEVHVFDPKATFLPKYAVRRQTYSSLSSSE